MTTLEIKVHISGDELLALQKLAGTEDNLPRLRATARTIIKTTLSNAAAAMQSCIEGRLGDIELGEDTTEEQKKL